MLVITVTGIVILGAIVIKVGIWLTYKTLFGKVFRKVDSPNKIVALTFDDGPDPNCTIKLLDIFKSRGIKVTFFMLGQKIEKYPDIVKKIHQADHEIGNHSYSHSRLIFKSPSFIRNEIEKTDEILKNLGIPQSKLFRPPYGQQLIAVPYYLSKLGKRNINWNVDPKDFETTKSEQIVSRVLSKIESGSIVLLHDNKAQTVNAVKEIVDHLKLKGFEFMTVSELLNVSSGVSQQ